MMMLQLRGRVQSNCTPWKKLQATDVVPSTVWMRNQPAAQVRLISATRQLMRRHETPRASQTDLDMKKMWQDMHEGKELFNQLKEHAHDNNRMLSILFTKSAKEMLSVLKYLGDNSARGKVNPNVLAQKVMEKVKGKVAARQQRQGQKSQFSADQMASLNTQPHSQHTHAEKVTAAHTTKAETETRPGSGDTEPIFPEDQLSSPATTTTSTTTTSQVQQHSKKSPSPTTTTHIQKQPLRSPHQHQQQQQQAQPKPLQPQQQHLKKSHKQHQQQQQQQLHKQQAAHQTQAQQKIQHQQQQQTQQKMQQPITPTASQSKQPTPPQQQQHQQSRLHQQQQQPQIILQRKQQLVEEQEEEEGDFTDLEDDLRATRESSLHSIRVGAGARGLDEEEDDDLYDEDDDVAEEEGDEFLEEESEALQTEQQRAAKIERVKQFQEMAQQRRERQASKSEISPDIQRKIERKRRRVEKQEQNRLKNRERDQLFPVNLHNPVQWIVKEQVPMVDEPEEVERQQLQRDEYRVRLIEARMKKIEDEINKATDAKEALDPVKKEHLTSPKVKFFQSNIEVFIANNQIEKALEFLEQMKGEGFKPARFVYNHFINYYAQKQDLTMAKEMYRDLKRHCIDAPSRSSVLPLLDLLSKLGRVDEILPYVDDLTGLKGVDDPQLLINTVVIQAYINTARLDKAIEHFEEMKRKKLAVDEQVYLLLINGCAQLKQREHVAALWEEMSQIFPPSDKSYSALVEVYLSKEDANPLQAAELIQTVLDNHLNLEPRTWNSFLNYLISREIRPEDAEELIAQLAHKGQLGKFSRKDERKLQDFLTTVKKHIVRTWEGVDLILTLNKDLLPGV